MNLGKLEVYQQKESDLSKQLVADRRDINDLDLKLTEEQLRARGISLKLNNLEYDNDLKTQVKNLCYLFPKCRICFFLFYSSKTMNGIISETDRPL